MSKHDDQLDSFLNLTTLLQDAMQNASISTTHAGTDWTVPQRILLSGNRTIVWWGDGSKTIVKLDDSTTPDSYAAFTAALAKRIYGSNSQVHKMLNQHLYVQEGRYTTKVSID